jgi:16S rRNA processing protein RimM
MDGRRILVGEIGRPHGVRGLVKLKSFTSEPASIASYGPLTDATGTRRFVVTWKGDGVAAIEGVADRDAAQRLTGTKLYVERDRLPATEEDEFYLSDLIGLAAVTEAGQPAGTVKAVEDHGAGTFLVLSKDGRETEVPFTKAAVPVVDIAARRVVVAPLAEVFVQPQREEDAA